jgi:cyclophilin family peptidyl-prolyl cis-trans isomerase
LIRVALVALQIVACRHDAPRADERRPTPVSMPVQPATLAVNKGIARAEYLRSTAAMPEGSLTDRSVEVRRAASRALARIADDAAMSPLRKALADEDPEVVAWAAYGLGVACAGREAETVRALVTRATSIEHVAPSSRTDHGFSVSPLPAIADALSRCGSAPAEQTLRAWLEGDRGELSALALGRLAERRHRLDDATVVALLEAAARPSPIAAALYAMGQLDVLSGPSQKRLLEVATRAMTHGGSGRSFAVRALVAAGPSAVDALALLLTDGHATLADRSAAATTLGRLGSAGQAALGGTLARLAPGEHPVDDRWLTAHFAPLSATLAALTAVTGVGTTPLSAIAELPLNEKSSAAVRRRTVSLRCGAAAALAGTASQSVRLIHCDPDPHGRTGALATLRVLDRGELIGPRLEGWRELVRSASPIVRRTALALLPRHPEVGPVADLLAQSLVATEPGIVAQAARVLCEAPRLASNEPRVLPGELPAPGAGRVAGTQQASPTQPSAEIVEALARALDADRPPDQIETRVALASAAATLGVLSLKSRVERHCASDNVTLRRSAEIALGRLGGGHASCPSPASNAAAPDAPGVRGPVTLTFVTDGGRLGVTLDPALSPWSVDQVVGLARSGFYDRVAVHRVSPGLLVQFGDPVGDGSGGSGRPPLPSETSPAEFGALSVGLALGGRDTGSSQIFVTLAPEPHLFGDYPLLGWADPEWDGVAEGDVIERVEVRE